jgi:transposase
MEKRKKWSAAVKFEIAILVLKGEQTINDICKHYEVAPAKVKSWKNSYWNKAQKYSTKLSKKLKWPISLNTSKLYEKIGQLTVERDFLKKHGTSYKGTTTRADEGDGEKSRVILDIKDILKEIPLYNISGFPNNIYYWDFISS